MNPQKSPYISLKFAETEKLQEHIKCLLHLDSEKKLHRNRKKPRIFYKIKTEAEKRNILVDIAQLLFEMQIKNGRSTFTLTKAIS